MKTIPLTRGKVAIVDDKDFTILSKFSWHAAPRKKTFYAAARIPAIRKVVYMHRFLIGAKPGQKVDHWDRDGLNNRRSNLRSCTSHQNCMNKGPKSHSSKFKGVEFNKMLGKWTAQIKFHYKKRHLGVFVDEVDAAAAYNKAARKLFGKFAYLNPLP